MRKTALAAVFGLTSIFTLSAAAPAYAWVCKSASVGAPWGYVAFIRGPVASLALGGGKPAAICTAPEGQIWESVAAAVGAGSPNVLYVWLTDSLGQEWVYNGISKKCTNNGPLP